MQVDFSESINYQDVLDDSDKEAIKSFQYHGKDDSIFYEYVMSPFCQWVVDNILPEKLAPNMITLIGLSFIAIPHVLIMTFYPDEKSIPHRLFYLMSALGTLLYSIFDNLDGKQARKRAQASPLGMLFDHGCDSLNSFLNAMIIARLFLISRELQGIAVALVACAFYFATLEQYFTDYFYLPRVNSVNEGIMFLVFIKLLAFVFGGQIFRETAFGIIQWNHLVLIILIVSAVTSCLGK